MNKLYFPLINVSRILFVSLITFDSFVSYWAVKYRGAKEMDLLISPIVEKYPLSYFIFIPILIVIMHLVVNMITHFAAKTNELSIIPKKLIRRLVLSSLALYWAIGNSSLNLLFILGYRQPPISWMYTTITAIFVVGIYIIFTIKNLRQFDSSNY